MIIKAYSVYDRKSLVYNPPFFAPTDGAATRILADAVSDANTSLSRHPADYVLFCVGAFDDQKGELAVVQPLIHVVDVMALVPAPAPSSLFDKE